MNTKQLALLAEANAHHTLLQTARSAQDFHSAQELCDRMCNLYRRLALEEAEHAEFIE